MANTEFVVNNDRYDPYQNWRFRVTWGTKVVAGINRIRALTRTTKVVQHRVGFDPGGVLPLPGQTEYGPITLERGVTHDKEFEQWANKMWAYSHSKTNPAVQIVSLNDFRKNLTIQLFNEAGQMSAAYNVYRCWVSQWQAQADLDGTGKAILIQSLKLENEGWERDYSVAEATQTAYLAPP